MLSKEFIFKMLCVLTVLVAIVAGNVNFVATRLYAETDHYELMTNESLTRLVPIQLYAHVTGQIYQQFLADYSQYQLKRVIEACSFCLTGMYVFNSETIAEDDFRAKLKDDPRVYLLTTGAHYIFDGRFLSIRLSEGVDQNEFKQSYFDYSLRGSSPDLFDGDVFTFNDTIINPWDFFLMLFEDDRVEYVNFAIGWIDGEINVMLENWVIDEALDTFVEDYSHYGIEIRYQHAQLNIYSLLFDHILYDEFQLLHELETDARVIRAHFKHIYTIDPECRGPVLSTNDDTVIPMHNVYVYPNPVRGEDVTIRWGNPPLSPLTKGGNALPQEINIYNVRGQLVIKSNDFQTKDGENVFVWNRRDDRGQEVASGVYLYRIQYIPHPVSSQAEGNISTGRETITGKFLILK